MIYSARSFSVGQSERASSKNHSRGMSIIKDRGNALYCMQFLLYLYVTRTNDD
jgi:hypothetical protein